MNESLWTQLRTQLRDNIPPHVYSAFVESIEFLPSGDGRGTLAFGDTFTKENFEEKCWPAFKSLLETHAVDPSAVALAVLRREPAPVAASTYRPRNPFDGRYTFDNFVVGQTNQFAHAACQAVARQPGECYNPLFIFGGAGLGKTHLLKAIGHEISTRDARLKILFLTSESFTNELIQALRLKQMNEFHDKYRSGCDVLLIDDVHFLAGKERTQEEFFYTFNFLHEARKQIVVTSDRYPKDIQGLEARLQTRFEWGLVADVQPPEIETRIAILKNKAEQDLIEVPDEVVEFLATHITSNVRELEGSLHRLQAYASMSGAPASLPMAMTLFRDATPKVAHALTPEGILKLVALHFNVRTTDLRSEKRVRKLSVPRQVCMYLLRKHLLMSFPEIGKFLGGRDHTTVMHAVQKVGEQQKSDPDILAAITAVEGLIR
jgi:chromosomal replication initiator protein